MQKTVWCFIEILEIELLYDLVILLLVVYPKKSKTLIWKDICNAMFISALFTTAETGNHPQCPLTNEWRKKVEYYPAIKKNENLPFVTTWTELAGIM